MSKQPGSHNTPPEIVEEILRLYIEKGYSYRQLAEKFRKPFKIIQNMIHNEYKKQRQLRMENELLREFYRSQEKGEGWD